MTLAELQRDFRQWLVSSSEHVTHHISGQGTKGLAVYQNNYRAQLMGCLEVSYPHLRQWLGEDAFLQAAIAHIDSHPPHAWTLDAYGADFVDTLRTMFPHNPDVHELAWIEWSLSDAFVARDAELVSNEALAAIDWDSARLWPSPSLRLRQATTNAGSLWSALEHGSAPEESEMLDAPGGLAVWRKGFTCQIKQLDAIEHAALLSLQEDNRFASLCDALVQHLGEEAGITKAGALLADWIGAGIVATVTSGEDDEHDLIDPTTATVGRQISI